MRYVAIACLMFCCTLSGCAWYDEWQGANHDGLNSINLWPTDKETRAGER